MTVRADITVETLSGMVLQVSRRMSNVAAVSGVVVDVFEEAEDPEGALLDWTEIRINVRPESSPSVGRR